VTDLGGNVTEWPSLANVGAGPTLYPDATESSGPPPWQTTDGPHWAVGVDGYALAAALGEQTPADASFLVVARVDEAGSWFGDYGLRYLALQNEVDGTLGWYSPDTWTLAAASLPKYGFLPYRAIQSVRDNAAPVNGHWPDDVAEGGDHLPGDLHLIFGRKAGGTIDLDLYYFDTGEWFRASGPTTAAGFDFDKLWVGGEPYSGTFFTGTMYQAAWWNRALTAEEQEAVAAHFAEIYG